MTVPNHSTNGTFFTSNDKAKALENVILKIWNHVIRKEAYKDQKGNPVYNKDTELNLEHVHFKNWKTNTDMTWEQVGSTIVTAISENNAALQAQIDSNQSRWDSAMLQKTDEFTTELGRKETQYAKDLAEKEEKHAKDAEIWALDLANQIEQRDAKINEAVKSEEAWKKKAEEYLTELLVVKNRHPGLFQKTFKTQTANPFIV